MIGLLNMEKNFEIHLHNGKKHDSTNHTWSEHSERIEVEAFGSKKIVHLSKHDVKKICVFHDGKTEELEVPKGARVYQATRSEAVFLPDGTAQHRIIGKLMGIVKDGKVIEEIYIDGLQGQVFGLRI